MARIRTIKPEFFRHRRLFQAERDTGLPCRVAFAGLWTVADRDGRFKWDPDDLKLQVLPWDDVDFGHVLHALATRHFIVPYEVAGTRYGVIPGFHRHQVINNRESKSILPKPPAGFDKGLELQLELTPPPRVPDASPTRADAACEEGKGKEREREKEKEGKSTSSSVKTAAREATASATARQFHERYAEVRQRCDDLLRSPNCHVWGRVDAWLTAGADPEADIYPTLERLKPSWNGRKLEYFDGAIADAVASRTRPLPEGNAANGQANADQGSSSLIRSRQEIREEMQSKAKVIAQGTYMRTVSDHDVRGMIKLGWLTPDQARAAGYQP